MSWNKRINGADGTPYILDIHHRTHKKIFTNFNITISKVVGNEKFPMETTDLQFNMKTKEFNDDFIYSPFVESILQIIKKTLLNGEGEKWGVISFRSLLKVVSLRLS
jgi:hypothetical protein